MSMISKFKGFVLGESDDEFDSYDEDENTIEEDEEEREEPVISKTIGNNVVNIHSVATTKVVVIRPKNYDEAEEIADAVKARKIVVVNTNDLEAKVAQRLIDFTGGATFVLGGQLQEIEQRVYLLSPSNVEVSNELKNELVSKNIFSWNR